MMVSLSEGRLCSAGSSVRMGERKSEPLGVRRHGALPGEEHVRQLAQRGVATRTPERERSRASSARGRACG